MYKAMSITIKGRVQGVGFRYSARSTARMLGIKGIVKNKYDGSVYIEAEGDEEDINKFIQWCHVGPDHAKIQSVTTDIIALKYSSSFEVTS